MLPTSWYNFIPASLFWKISLYSSYSCLVFFLFLPALNLPISESPFHSLYVVQHRGVGVVKVDLHYSYPHSGPSCHIACSSLDCLFQFLFLILLLPFLPLGISLGLATLLLFPFQFPARAASEFHLQSALSVLSPWLEAGASTTTTTKKRFCLAVFCGVVFPE